MAPEDDEFGQESLVLQGGDRLLLYSDGLTDTMNNDGEVFGAARLLEAVQGRADESLDGLIRAVMDEARTWRGPAELNDDISVVALEISRAR
jgi:sigma-B regulation protein RsbU (phosphoserine phosphatase)